MRLVSMVTLMLRLSAIFLLFAGMFVWIQLESSVQFAFERVCAEIIPSNVGWRARSIGALIGTMHLAFVSAAMFSLISFLQEGANGGHLSAKAVICFRRFALLIFIYVVTTPIMNVLSSQLLTGKISIVLNTDDLKLLVGSGVLVVVSHVLSVGRIAKVENESFL